MTIKLTKVLIADDHSIVRRGVINIIRESWGNIDILQAETFEQVLVDLQQPADLLILDINMPGGNNVAMLDVIKTMQPAIKTLIFSSYDEQMFAFRYMQAGADGYLNKNSDEPDIIKAINTVLEGRQYVSQQLKNTMLETVSSIHEQSMNPMASLSNRELEVGLHLSQGKGVLEIATIMNLKMGTVSTYKARAFEKIGVKNIVELAEKFKLYGAISNPVA